MKEIGRVLKKQRELLIRTFFICLFVAFSITISGCIIGDRVTRPLKTSGKRNTFKHNLRSLNEKILTVRVWHFNPVLKMDTVVWKIEAKRKIPAWGFTVTVGKVPEGFEQVIPTPPKQFQPIAGVRYSIFIGTKPSSVHALSTHWIAEALKGE